MRGNEQFMRKNYTIFAFKIQKAGIASTDNSAQSNEAF